MLGPSEACKLDLGIQGLDPPEGLGELKKKTGAIQSQASDSQCLEGSSRSVRTGLGWQ